EHERPARTAVQRAPERATATGPRARHRREPARDVGGDAQVATAGSARQPQVRLPEPELLEKTGDLLDLLAGRGEDVGMAALVQSQQDRRQLDQLPGRAEDDQDHRRSSPAPRHIPSAWPSAYTGVTVASTSTSRS